MYLFSPPLRLLCFSSASFTCANSLERLDRPRLQTVTPCGGRGPGPNDLSTTFPFPGSRCAPMYGARWEPFPLAMDPAA